MSKKMTTRTRTVLTLAAVAMAILGLTTTSANAGVISYVQITNDADCGISAGKTYTHKLDFGTGSPGALINGVQFDAYNNAANGTLNFNREVFSGLLSDHAGNAGHNVSGSLVDLMTDMYYNGNNAVDGTRTWTLSGLTAGHTYDTRIYTRQWGPDDNRLVTFVFDPDGAGPVSDSTVKISQDNATSMGFTNGNDAYYINYKFKAVAGEDLVITLTQDIFNYSWHLYGLTNEIAGPVTKAYGPNPKDGVLLTDIWTTILWSPGDFAASHDVYFGDNFDDVNDGTPDSSGFWGSQDTTTFFAGFFGYPYPDGLVSGTTYYWRIDEVNDTEPNSPWKGDVWSFWIQPRIAYEPDPADGAKFVDPNADLNWTAGLNAAFHYVYFGENFDDVNSAVGNPMQTDTTYTPGTLELDKTYYWRVDESIDTVTMLKGNVWSFKTLPDIPITDPNLVGWWKLDEGERSTTVVDWSGHGNHGTINGNPQWVTGYFDGALAFDGSSDYVDIDFSPELSLNEFTLSAWVKIATEPGIFGIHGTRAGADFTFDLKVQADNIHGDIGNGSAWIDTTIDIESNHTGTNGQGGDLAVDTWYMITYVIDNTNQQVRLYLDGDLKRTIYISGIPLLMQSGQSMSIGHTGTGSEWMNGLIDDIHIYNKALTVDEIKQAMRGDLLLTWDPNPANGSTPYIREATPLSWSAGDNASGHDVYFGIDKDAVADANASDMTGTYRGQQVGTSYTPPEGVEWGGGPYYWRIDEYNTDATISEGKIWSFTVADFIVIEDFEDYNDYEPDTIFDAWLDGWGLDTNGSEVGYATPDFPAGEHFVETNIVHGGSQSMPYFYDTNFKYSEVTYSPTRPNWTEEGVGVLSLWFRGNPAGLLEGPAGTYTMSGAGTDIWGTADEFRYAWKQLSGAGTISAQVLSVEDTDGWAKAGVMIRESLDPGSKFAALYIAPDNGCRFQARLVTGVDAISDSDVTTLADIEAPHWIKLERDAAGNFNAYNSDDGVTWTPLAWNPQNISMGTNVYIGLALTSHNSGVTCVAEFSDVETTGAVTPLTWTHEAIGATMVANDPAPMYVALNGGTAVYHGDLNAPLIGTWTEWTIDLQEFIGVNLTNVNTLAIGFGDKNNLQPGGSGLVFFDDIRLYRPEPEPEPQP